jgi:undecaprenyl pyrophosphate phosphatase UppP
MLIGIAQIGALIPGVSRSGSTTVVGIWVDVLKAAKQRDILGTQFFLQFIYFLRQLFSFTGFASSSI